MTEETAARLLRIYRMAVEEENNVVANMLEDIIVEAMSYRTKPVMRGTPVDGDGEVVG